MAATEIAFAKSFLALLDTKPTKITPDHVEDPRGYPSSSPVCPSSSPTILPLRPLPPLHSPQQPPPQTNKKQYTLPRLPTQKPPPRRPRNPTTTTPTSPAPGSTPPFPIHIRSLRNPPLDLTLASLPLATTSALDIKLAVADETGIPVEKIKLLLNKKPVPDTRSLREMVAAVGGGGDVGGNGLELGVMVMGGRSGAIAWKKVVDVGAGGGGSGGAIEKEKGGAAAGGAPVVAQGLSGKAVLETEAFWGDLKGFLEQRIRDEAVAVEAVEKFRGAWGRG